MLCHSDLPNTAAATVDQLMDQLYPRIFSTFIKLNPALETRALFYRRFFNAIEKNILANPKSKAPLRVLEVGSGTGIGSANNAEILKNLFKFIQYVAIDKRETLVSMTASNLRSVLNTTNLSTATYVRDGLHGMSQHELPNFGFNDGRVDVYFSEHSAYSELYDPNKATNYFAEIKEIVKPCGLALIVVQTEKAEMQKLATRNMGHTSNYLQHIVNLEKSLQDLNFTVSAKYLNPVNLTFPKLTSTEWLSIKSRYSNLDCFLNPQVEKALELMTFIKVPLNCLNNTELDVYIENLQNLLNKRNYQIPNDEYIYAIFNGENCPTVHISDIDDNLKIKTPESITSAAISRGVKVSKPTPIIDSILSSAPQAITHGILRGSTQVIKEKLINRGTSEKSADFISQFAYYSGFFTLKFVSHCQQAETDENEQSFVTALCNAALETGESFFVNQALQILKKLLERSEKILERKTHYSLLSKGVKLCKSVLPFSIFANNNGVIATSAAIVLGGAAEAATIRSMKKFGQKRIEDKGIRFVNQL